MLKCSKSINIIRKWWKSNYWFRTANYWRDSIHDDSVVDKSGRDRVAQCNARAIVSTDKLDVKYTAYMDPWRARRALGVNEGRSCDRSIFPKSRGGPIRRHIKAGRIISNLYCRRIRARVCSARSLDREKKTLSISPSPRALVLSFSFIVLFCTPTLSFKATL